MKNKKILIVCLIIIIVASISTIIYILTQKNKETPDYIIEGINLVENKDILKDSTVSNLKITNISLLTREGITSFKAELSNDTDEEVEIYKLYVVFYENDKENKILALNNITLASNNKTHINITSETDLSKTTKIEYVIENNKSE